MSQILQELVRSGYPVESEAMAALSPYWTNHVNRFGIYDPNLDRCPPALDFDTALVPAPTS